MTKHFPGGGPQKKDSIRILPFRKDRSIRVITSIIISFLLKLLSTLWGTAAIMPYYGVPMDQTDENVGMSYNKTIITKLLREKYRFDGVVAPTGV